MGCHNCCSEQKDDAVSQVIKSINRDLDMLESGTKPAGTYHSNQLQQLRERLEKVFSK